MKNDLNLCNTTNMEEEFLWLQIKLTRKDEDEIDHVLKFLKKIGRMKFIRPIFNLLYSYNKDLALKTFSEDKSLYHPLLVNLIEKDFQSKTTTTTEKFIKE